MNYITFTFTLNYIEFTHIINYIIFSLHRFFPFDWRQAGKNTKYKGCVSCNETNMPQLFIKTQTILKYFFFSWTQCPFYHFHPSYNSWTVVHLFCFCRPSWPRFSMVRTPRGLPVSKYYLSGGLGGAALHYIYIRFALFCPFDWYQTLKKINTKNVVLSTKQNCHNFPFKPS